MNFYEKLCLLGLCLECCDLQKILQIDEVNCFALLKIYYQI
jgi:hypothetical protein